MRSSVPPGGKDRPEVRDRCARIVDVLQRLRDDDAVEALIGERAAHAEVRDDRRLRVRRVDVDDVALGDGRAAETERVRVIAHLEHPPLHCCGVTREEGLDVETVDRQPAVEAPVVAERTLPAQIAPHGGSLAAAQPRDEVANGPRKDRFQRLCAIFD